MSLSICAISLWNCYIFSRFLLKISYAHFGHILSCIRKTFEKKSSVWIFFYVGHSKFRLSWLEIPFRLHNKIKFWVYFLFFSLQNRFTYMIEIYSKEQKSGKNIVFLCDVNLCSLSNVIFDRRISNTYTLVNLLQC